MIRFNTLRPRQNGCHFADDIFKCIFLNEDVWILTRISLKFVCKGPINNIAGLVQIMAWRGLGNKPLSESMMISLLAHICVARPRGVNAYFGKCHQRSLLLTWINFNHSMSWISNYIHHKVWDEFTYPLSNFNGAAVEVWEWISNFIPHFLGHVITCTYPCWDQGGPSLFNEYMVS